jgi:TonB family protein
MKQHAKAQPPRPTGHMTIRPEGEGADIRVLFEDQPTSTTRVLSGTVVHAIAISALLVIGYFLPEKVYETILPDRLPDDIVWLSDPGPGGGGGGGNKSPEPPKQAELKGVEKITVPAEKPPEVTPEPVPETPVIEPQLIIPAQTMAAAPTISPGAISASTTTDDSRGSGTGSGAGPGTGSGLGPGSGGGDGGGVYRPGNGVVLPIVLQDKKPAYTAEAMRAKVQGTVLLEAVVLPDGSVGTVEIVRSLDSTFGLDQEAVKAAKQWRFRPGTRFGEPVAVLVTIELTFTLR